jgi:predicted transcriptional regulator
MDQEVTMGKKKEPQHSRREKEIMDIIYRMGEASVNDIMDKLTDSPTSGAVRRMLNLLHAKGVVTYRHEGAKKMYRSKVAKNVAGEKALKHLVETFFAGSAARTVASLFRSSDLKLSAKEKKMLEDLIEKTKDKGR